MDRYNRVILVRYGEIVLKGLNRHMFENKLIANIKRALRGMPEVEVILSQGRIFIEPCLNTVQRQSQSLGTILTLYPTQEPFRDKT